MTQTTTPANLTGAHTPLVDSALRYAANNIPVFPLHGIDGNQLCTCTNPDCSNPGKHPINNGLNFLDETSTDATTIEKWWNDYPEANIGIPTGEASGWYVIDINKHLKGVENYKSFLNTQPKGSITPASFKSNTGSGGYHLVYGKPLNTTGELISTNNSSIAGVSFRGDRGYIVAPPSRHANGSEYQWINQSASPLEEIQKNRETH